LRLTPHPWYRGRGNRGEFGDLLIADRASANRQNSAGTRFDAAARDKFAQTDEGQPRAAQLHLWFGGRGEGVQRQSVQYNADFCW
jgi:hypothetical protein